MFGSSTNPTAHGAHALTTVTARPSPPSPSLSRLCIATCTAIATSLQVRDCCVKQIRGVHALCHYPLHSLARLREKVMTTLTLSCSSSAPAGPCLALPVAHTQVEEGSMSVQRDAKGGDGTNRKDIGAATVRVHSLPHSLARPRLHSRSHPPTYPPQPTPPSTASVPSMCWYRGGGRRRRRMRRRRSQILGRIIHVAATCIICRSSLACHTSSISCASSSSSASRPSSSI
jgi:hypothetical protein